MNFQFLLNPFKLRKSSSPQNTMMNSSEVSVIGSGIKSIRFQPIVRKKTYGGSLKRSNNIRMIF